MVYDGLDDFCERWYTRKVSSVGRRQQLEIQRRDEEIAEKALRVKFVEAVVVTKRIVIPSNDMVAVTQEELNVDKATAKTLLGRSLLSLTLSAVEREREELSEAKKARREYAALTPEDIYASELEELHREWTSTLQEKQKTPKATKRQRVLDGRHHT